MSFLKSVMIRIRVLVGIALLCVSFYSGMYIMSATQNPEDAKGVMIAKIEKIFQNTSDQPVIRIVPEHSLFEKAKLKVGMELPKREVITITTTDTKHMLGLEVADPSIVKTAFVFWADKSIQAEDGVKSGWSWWSDKVTFMD